MANVVSSGDTSGDVPFFFKMRHWLSAKANKVNGATVLRLPRDRLSHLLKMYPKEEEEVAQNAMRLFNEVREANTGKAKSAYSKSSSKCSSKRSASSRGSRFSQQKSSNEGDMLSEEEDQDSDDDADSDVFDQVVGAGLKARITGLSERRKADAINRMCMAAFAGNLEGLRELHVGRL